MLRLFGLPSFRTILRKPWMRVPLIIIGIICLIVAIWFGFVRLPWWPLPTVWFRLTIIGVILSIIFLVMFLKWRKRRRAAKALEAELIQEPVGDGDVLNERMTEALAKLKKSGGKSYLYDLPWYIIIGPPGAGKTTALKNSGIEFPGTDMETVEGFGGTKNCDWWFAEDAVLIDTAGRYTTQDSDAEADQLSWSAFLGLLKKGRPKQPINGVLLAFSAEDMMSATEQDLVDHAATVRARLAEIHETLKIDFPVYVLFTKADLISGFREYFSSFNQSRRKLVWGTTFQTKNRKEQTWQTVPEEFDALVSRLSDEVIDRMSEEPDGISRISIFGLPGQMALLRDNVADFMRRVFEPTRYDTNAILRGFYFTSGTQEGTPIDQVLGAMQRNAGEDAGAFQPDFMSGKGKSYFLHDLMKQVVFAERDWVNHDAKAVRRAFILRTATLSIVGVLAIGMMTLLGFSFWQNASLIRQANAEATQYLNSASAQLGETVIDDPNPSAILSHLNRLKNMTAGYGDETEQTLLEGFGLGQRAAINAAADKAYSDALERLLRPRMILQVENDLELFIRDEDVRSIYSALKVYILLGGQQEGASDDEAIIAYFNGSQGIWRQYFGQLGQEDEREQIEGHVLAMLELDDSIEPSIPIDAGLIERARREVVDLPLAEQRWAVIQERALTSGVESFNFLLQVGERGNIVFEHVDGLDLATHEVAALYTFNGYWGFFVGEVERARTDLEADEWVLGEVAELINYDQQLANLEVDLHRLYQVAFREAWFEFLAKLEMRAMSADAPQFNALETLGAADSSPLFRLVEKVRYETQLVRFYDEIDALLEEGVPATPQGLFDRLGGSLFRQQAAQSGLLGRIVARYVADSAKNQNLPGGGAGGLSEDTQRRQVERIGEAFEDWHLLMEGDRGARPIDALLIQIRELRANRFNASVNPTPADEQTLRAVLAAMTANVSRLPDPIEGWINEIDQEFRRVAQDASFAELNRVFNSQVVQYCQSNIEQAFPFGDGAPVPPGNFGEFFGPGGRMDSFFINQLSSHVTRSGDTLVPRPESPLADRLSPNALRQIARALAIQRSFFTGSSDQPEVAMSVAFVESSPGITFAQFEFHGRNLGTASEGDAPRSFTWPGEAPGIKVTLFGNTGNLGERTFGGGRWAILDLLRRANVSRSGPNVVDATIRINGAFITLRISAESDTVPFIMPELADFSCPTSLE